MFDKRYLKQLYKSFKSTGGFIIGTIGGICSILSFIYKEDLGINPYLVICGTIILIVIISLIDVSLHFYNETLNNSPEVYKVIIRGDTTILLTAYSEYLQVQGLVTIYWFNEGFEEFVGYGEVINIQNDKKIQIDLRKMVAGITNLEEKRKSLIIKPFVTTKTIEE
jgi:hypothetical protein